MEKKEEANKQLRQQLLELTKEGCLQRIDPIESIQDLSGTSPNPKPTSFKKF